MSRSRIASIPGTAVWAVTHPLQTTGRVAGFAKGVVVGGIGIVESFRQTVPEETVAGTAPPSQREPEAPKATEPEATVPEATPTPATPAPEPGYVVNPPNHAPPEEPPVDVVEQALAAEAAGPDPVSLGGPATEPHPVTRAEDHGEAPLVREERDEIDEETQEALAPEDDESAIREQT